MFMPPRVGRSASLRRLALVAGLGASWGCPANIATQELPGASAPSDAPSAGGADPAEGADAAPGAGLPFEAVGQRSAANKIKTLLTGRRVTEQEGQQADTEAGLTGLVDAWMATPEFADAMLVFFSWATQQSQVLDYYSTQLPGNNGFGPKVLQMVREQFGRTARDIAERHLPFHQIATTQEFMVTPRLLQLYSLAEDLTTDDQARNRDWLLQNLPRGGFTLTTQQSIPMAQSIDPGHANFMTFSTSSLTNDCNVVPQPVYVAHADTQYVKISQALMNFLNSSPGAYIGGYLTDSAGKHLCHIIFAPHEPLLPAETADVWRRVRLRRPNPGEVAHQIYDREALLGADTFILRTPRIGFWSTLAFLGQWGTNANNDGRSTINQTLITGIGRNFNGMDSTQPVSTALIPTSHADPSSSCYGCHLTMDPMRQFFRQAYTVYFDPQMDPNFARTQAIWAQEGVTEQATDIADLGRLMASSPSFASAWVQRTCTWINSSPCSAADPELVAITQRFVAGRYDFYAMLRDLLLSPITRYSQPTATADKVGTTMTMARVDQLCNSLSRRLGSPDLCSRALYAAPRDNRQTINNLTAFYPADGYSRNSVAPSMVSAPTVSQRMGLESICGLISLEAIDGAGSTLLSSNPNDVLDRLVDDVMAPPEALRGSLHELLTGSYSEGRSLGLSAREALRSSFITACLSPYVAMVGMGD